MLIEARWWLSDSMPHLYYLHASLRSMLRPPCMHAPRALDCWSKIEAPGNRPSVERQTVVVAPLFSSFATAASALTLSLPSSGLTHAAGGIGRDGLGFAQPPPPPHGTRRFETIIFCCRLKDRSSTLKKVQLRLLFAWCKLHAGVANVGC